MDHGYIRNLLEKQAAGTLTDEQWSELEELINSPAHQAVVQEVFMEVLRTSGAASNINDNSWKEVVENIVSIDKPGTIAATIDSNKSDNPASIASDRVHFLRKWGWAAAVIILLGTSVYIWNINNKKNTTTDLAYQRTDILPGKEGAILTLADGTNLVLDSAGNRIIARQNGTDVVLREGLLAYDPSGEASGNIEYNTMSTPKGRQFKVLLPDGTGVWLNAASSIKYPTVFTGKERKVEITGEAYFEIVKNTKMPFRVIVNNQAEIEVLGTHFNVNAYENETTINTTLIEGSIRVNALLPGSNDVDPSLIRDDKQSIAPRNSIILQPGQQAQITTSQTNQKESQELTVIENVATDRVMAWKEGFFNFEGLAFEQLMRQLERWYDIQVVYENGIPHKKLIGKMTKDVSLNGLLIGLKELGIHCRLEARKLIILP